MKIKHADGFEGNGEGAPEGACKWIEGEASSEFRHVDPVKFGELVASLGLDYEEGCWPTLYNLVGGWSCSPDEPEVGRNQSASRHEVWRDRLGLKKVSM